MGAFATRDILPGEIVLVDFTSIVITNGHIAKDCYQIAERYEELEEEEKQEWRNLAGFPWNSRANHYRTIYNLPRPDGLVLPENGEFYTLLNLQFDCNTFAISDAKSALFLKASRFNHSCDPNVWYENSEVEGRWVGRANRHIKQGQELFISYLPNHNPLDGRQKEASNWGFICDCDKCLEMPDEYTASLQEARDIANGIEPDRGWVPPSHGNTVAAMEDQLRRRVTLLREAYDKMWGAKMDDAYGKELVFA
ncbi:hypothetical protein NUW58_g3576 [Xylaria curta]|uniref:Uncharacterized protein n=1 Tax=Xylaria curta TaxID=42375 RepID=A0ACC1PBN8_9PEZI|nr:hypothetical protein NUW58_g3576 [Xylaria curta]